MNSNNQSLMEIGQTLHGYDGGHQLIEQSFSLSSRARHTVLQFSDRSVDSKLLPESGYLTGYPLIEENLYVLSRTWPARDMPRPGCVWTHSLYITFTDLARVEDATTLLRLFRRPTGTDFKTTYAKPILYDPNSNFNLSSIEIEFAEAAIKELYLSPDEQVMLKTVLSTQVEETLIAIWSQQWPRLKRNFRFCSLTSRDRSTSDHCFDLQIITQGSLASSINTDSTNLLNDAVEENSDWLQASLADLTDSEHNLRKFLRRVGGDIEGGRERFAELCGLYWNTNQDNGGNSVEQMLDYVTHRLSQNEGKLLRKQAIDLATKNADQVSESNLMVILPYLEPSISEMPIHKKIEISKKYWNINPSIFTDSESPQFLRDTFEEVVKSIPENQLIKVVRSDKGLLLPTLKANPKLGSSIKLWKNLSSKVIEEMFQSNLSKGLKTKILKALISAERIDVSEFIVDCLGDKFVFNTALKYKQENSDSRLAFLSAALDVSAEATELVSEALRSKAINLSKSEVYLFTKHVSSTEPVHSNNSTEDIWVTVWNSAEGEISPYLMDDFQIFLIERALINGGNCSAAIFANVFDRFYERLGRGLVDYNLKSKISYQLAPSDIFNWSYQGRFMRTVAQMALRNSYTGKQIIGLSQDDRRLRQIIRLIGETKKGRTYLKKTIG